MPILLGPFGQASHAKSPSAIPPAAEAALEAPTEAQSGTKKQFVWLLMLDQSPALLTPSNLVDGNYVSRRLWVMIRSAYVDATGLPLYCMYAPLEPYCFK